MGAQGAGLRRRRPIGWFRVGERPEWPAGVRPADPPWRTTRAPEALELSWAADQAGELRSRYHRGPLTLSPRRGRDECCGVELTRGYQNRQHTRESIQPKRKETT